MHKIKNCFLGATAGLLLSVPFATAVAAPVIEIAATTLAQPTLVATSSLPLARPFLEQSAAADQHALAPVSRATPRKTPASQPSLWALLLVGAALVLMPRTRRVDNSFR